MGTEEPRDRVTEREVATTLGAQIKCESLVDDFNCVLIQTHLLEKGSGVREREAFEDRLLQPSGEDQGALEGLTGLFEAGDIHVGQRECIAR